VGAANFLEHGYCVIRSLLSPSASQFLADHALNIANLPQFRSGDQQVPGTPAIYGDPHMERLLEQITPKVEAAGSILVYPTYSYVRVYKHGDCLPKHRDRPACEISLSVSLAYEPDEPWPLWVDPGLGPVDVWLGRGDAVMYRGTEVFHWRDAFAGNYAAQVFLHYVDRQGPHREWKFDKRQCLGTSL
jgi:hypothetical protein